MPCAHSLSDLNQLCDDYTKSIDSFINADIATIEDPDVLKQAVSYALSSGGKRFRPLLTLLIAQHLKLDLESVLPFAASIEYIHTYSLIHDDMPCMDDDDYRRGKKSLHKQFNEWIALLTGSYLQSRAYHLITQINQPMLVVDLIKLSNESLLEKGLIGGQVLDLQSENQQLSDQEYQEISNRKTGALFNACIIGPVLMAKDSISESSKNLLSDFSKLFGLAYQLKDDLEDIQQDEIASKQPTSNSVSQSSLDRVKNHLSSVVEQMLSILDQLGNAELLKEFVRKVYG